MNKAEQVVRLRDAGVSNKQIALAMDMPVASVRRLASVGRHDEMPTGERTIGLVASRDENLRRKPRHIIIPDTQTKPDVPLEHLRWAGQYIAESKPDVVVHLGDHWDMPSLSAWEKRGSRFFEGRRYKDDVAAGNEGLRLFEEGLGGWQPKRKILLRGNHEDRITRAVDDDPRLEGVIGFHDFDDLKYGWEIADYLVPILVDGLTFCHYFANPANGRAYSGAVDTMLRNIGFSFVVGHSQGLRIGRRELCNGVTQTGLVAGSFYQHTEDYRGPQAAAEWRGILVLNEVANGNYDLMQVSMNYLRERFA